MATGLTTAFLEHAVRASSQYDSTCRELAAEVLRLRTENERLRVAVANQQGDNLCWISEPATARALPQAEFLESCRRYHGQLVAERGEADGLPTIAQLEAEVARLKAPHGENY